MPSFIQQLLGLFCGLSSVLCAEDTWRPPLCWVEGHQGASLLRGAREVLPQVTSMLPGLLRVWIRKSAARAFLLSPLQKSLLQAMSPDRGPFSTLYRRLLGSLWGCWQL